MRISCVLLVGLCFVQSVFAETETYQVVEGDRLAEILRQHDYGVEFRELLPFIDETIRLNPDVFKNGNANHLIPGASIELPHNPNKVVEAPVVEPDPEPVVAVQPEPEPEPEPIIPAIGTIDPKKGRVEVLRNNELLVISAQQKLIKDDVVLTKLDSVAEIELTDESRFTVGPQSEFSIDQYSFAASDTGSKSSEDSLIATIHRGALRVVTGLIGKFRQNEYRVNSALTVTVGIRGTDFTIRSCTDEVNCGDLYGVSTAVQDGGVSFKNETATIDLDKNQFTQIETASDVPELLPIPEGYFDLEISPSDIIVDKTWWQETIEWLEELF